MICCLVDFLLSFLGFAGCICRVHPVFASVGEFLDMCAAC